MRDMTSKLIEMCEGGCLSWETVARECLMQMSSDAAADVAEALGIDDDDE